MKTELRIEKIDVKIGGIAPIMFDRFVDHSKEARPADQKLYLAEKNIVVLPTENLLTFLAGENPAGCAKVFEGKRNKEYIRIIHSHVFFGSVQAPFLDEKVRDIQFNGFKGRFYIYEAAPRTKQGNLSIKQEIKPRPVLKMPWFLKFEIQLVNNNLIDSTKLKNWFAAGGIQIGIGTYRPRFGRFEVLEWKEK